MGNKIGDHLGQIDGRSDCHKTVLSAERVAKSEQKLLDQNSISYSRQCLYQSETHGNRGRLFPYQNTLAIDKSYLLVGGLFDLAESQLQIVVARAGTRCLED